MKIKILRSLVSCLLILSTATSLLRADHAADLRNERIPSGHKMHTPLRRAIMPASSLSLAGYTPQQLRHAYGFDQLSATGAGQIIAIVDAYGSSTLQADLDTFSAQFNIPSTTVQEFYPQGTPAEDDGWAIETSLDVEWAHAIAPGATIVVVAAQSALTVDLVSAVDYAVSLGATQVSMSWGGPEWSGETSSDFHFNVPGVTFFASSGDNGAGVEFPSCSPYVVGVGGTTLNLDSSGNITSETGWSGSGGGTSLYEAAPSYQAGWWSGAKRAVPDVAYDADPNTGVAVYLTGYGWIQILGGTSMSAPQWTALSALANSLRPQSINSAPGALYSLATANYAGYFHDITSGSNGTYSAGVGYDLVTGLGSPIANQLIVALAGGLSSQTAAPAFCPAAGSYASAQKVTIVSATSGASIRYTTDGSTPTETHGTVYSSPVSISANATLKALAYKSGLTGSAVTSGSYAFISQAVAPTFSPVANTYGYAQTVTLSTKTSGASIRYTIDSSTPTATYGTLYSGPVIINANTTLQAVAYKSGMITSPITSGTYLIDNIVTLANLPVGTNGGTVAGCALVLGRDGNYYSTTNNGGTSGDGTVFKVTPAGVLTTLVNFNGTNGTNPFGGLVLGTDGNFYGTTWGGGSSGDGTVYKMTPSGVLTTLVNLKGTNGADPDACMVQGSDGNFYGTTFGGGSSGNGTVFKMTPSGVLTTLVNFTGANGASPEAALLQGTDGNFYGTASSGGTYSQGTVFKMTPAGALTILYSFSGVDGSSPGATLIQGSDGNFYGTTWQGGLSWDPTNGNNGYGTVYKITPTGVLTNLVEFNVSNGAFPAAALVQGYDGNFYGTTSGGEASDGTAFKLTPAGVMTIVGYFDLATGSNSYAALVQGYDGNFYGTTEMGGLGANGIIFKLDFPPRTLTGSSGNGFHSLAMSSTQKGTFTAYFNATPSASPENAVVGLSKGAATAYTALSSIARFNPSGYIDAYNSTAYAAVSKIPYSAGVSYHFRLVVNVAANTYSVYVTAPGGSEQPVGLNYGFRTKQTSLDTWTLEVDANPANCSLTAYALTP
jgi:uncharacterized repeat protein (TIGR03803 family)